MSFPFLLGIGLALNAAAALLTLWRGSVDVGGATAGTVLGTMIFACGGPLFWLVLMAFFVSSTAIGYIHRSEKEWLSAIHEKGSRRDAFQVLANGGMGMLTAVLYRLTSDPAWAAAFAVSFASSTADTWASELGVLSPSAPVSLLTFRPVPRGVSGGVSLLGTLVALGGAFFIALVFGVVNVVQASLPGGFLRIAIAVTAAGFVGSVVDSLLGATVQAQYAAASAAGGPSTGDMRTVTERRFSPQGLPNRRVRGLSFVNNDVVNFASCASVTLAMALLAPLFF